MNIYALLVIMLLGISGCTTTYKGSIKGSSNQEESKSNKDIAGNSNTNQARP